MQPYFKQPSAEMCRRKFLGPGDECLLNGCMKGHKTVTEYDNGTWTLKAHDPVARVQFCNPFLQSAHDAAVDPLLVFFPTEV